MPSSRSATTGRVAGGPSEEQMSRAFRVVRFMALFAVRYALLDSSPGGAESKHSFGAWLCAEIEALGPAYVKVAQLAAASGAAPPTVTEALERLQDRASAPRFGELDGFTASLPPEVEVEDEPIAAASIGIVYRGRWARTMDVAVKVRRPGIARQLSANMWGAARVLKRLARFSPMADHLLDVVRRYRRSIRLELDYLNEARNMRELTRALSGISGWNVVPRVVFAAENIIVMTYEPGIRINDVGAISASGISPKKVADALLESFLFQCFSAGVFHSDPHPGNISVRVGAEVEETSLIWYDAGLVVACPEKWRDDVIVASTLLLRGDVSGIVDVMVAQGVVFDDARSRRAISKMVRLLLSKGIEKSEGVAAKVMDAVRNDAIWRDDLRKAFRNDSKYIMLGKSVATINAVCATLDPRFSLAQRAIPIVRRLWTPDPADETMIDTLRNVSNSLVTMPGRVSVLEDAIAESSSDANDRHNALEALATKLLVAQVLITVLVSVLIHRSA